MRRKINPELKEYLVNNGNKYIVKDLVKLVNKKFNENYKENELRKYLVRNKIDYKYENKNKSNPMGTNVPLGTEYIKPDGMTLVKVSKNEWKYKQRLIYEEHYGIKLKESDYIIFLNQDRTDFRIENLAKVTRKESSYLANMDIFSTDADVTNLSINLVKMVLKTKEMEEKIC